MSETPTTKRHSAFVRSTVGAVIFTLVYTPILGSMTATTVAAQTLQNTTSKFEYDANGNLTRTTDPRGSTRELHYDPLNRVELDVQPPPSPGAVAPAVGYAHDGNDNVRSVRDPRSLSTTYTVDGLGNTNELKSPDTGTTSMTYDAAGNLKTSTDARGKVTTYSYDALNRVSAISFTSGTGITFTYGAPDAPGAAGRLVNMTDESGSTSFGYSAFGELSAKTQTVVAGGRSLSFAVSYGYGSSGSANGKLVSMTYPSGNRVNYDYDAAGRVNRITLNPVARNGIGTDMSTNIGLITDIAYAPLGPVQQWQWGNSTPDNPSGYARTFDLDGRVSSYTLGNRAAGGVVRSVDYDEASRIKAFRHAGQDQPFPSALLDQTFAYDEIDRLTGFKSSAANQTFQYDASGNRIGATFGGAAYVNTIDPGSNRLMSTTGPMPPRNNQYDAAGNLVSDGTNTFVYSDRGRMASVTAGGATITLMYNGFGERVYRKSNADRTGVAGIFVYDEQGHLIGEYDTTTGRPAREMVYLGDLPVSVLTQTRTSEAQVVTNVFYIYPDHLGTPRLITRPVDNAIVWRWDDNDPFGTMPVVDNPSGLGVFTFNLRMPGQYYDKDVRLFYNYFRDYDPQIGRYVQSDPFGNAGSINAYGYARENPIGLSDPTGEMAVGAVFVLGALLLATAGAIWWQQTHPVTAPSPFDWSESDNDPLAASQGNVADTQIVNDYGRDASESKMCGKKPDDPCEWLKKNAGRYSPDRVKRTEKAWGCRGSRHGKGGRDR